MSQHHSHEGQSITIGDHIARVGAKIATGTFCNVYTCATEPTLIVKAFNNERQFRRTVLALHAIDSANTAAASDRAHIESIVGLGTMTSFDAVARAFTSIQYVLMPRYEIRLKDFIAQHVAQFEAGLPALAARAVARQIFAALDCLERANVVHGDIKPSNIMIRSPPIFDLAGVASFDTVLCDFGSARICDDATHQCRSASVGTIPFIAPEILLGKPYSFSADVWSSMATIFTVITGDTLFDVFNEDGLDYDIDMSGIAIPDPDVPMSTSASELGASESLSSDDDGCANDDIDFPMLYAHVVLMYRLLGKPPEAFCTSPPDAEPDAMTSCYHNGVPRYSPTIQPGTILQFLGSNYHSLNRMQMRSIEEFLMLGLQYLEIDRHPARIILEHPFLANASSEEQAAEAPPATSGPKGGKKKKRSV